MRSRPECKSSCSPDMSHPSFLIQLSRRQKQGEQSHATSLLASTHCMLTRRTSDHHAHQASEHCLSFSVSTVTSYLMTLFEARTRGPLCSKSLWVPPIPPEQLALATILQAYTGVSDDEVIEVTLMDRRWQARAGLSGYRAGSVQQRDTGSFPKAAHRDTYGSTAH